MFLKVKPALFLYPPHGDKPYIYVCVYEEETELQPLSKPPTQSIHGYTGDIAFPTTINTASGDTLTHMLTHKRGKQEILDCKRLSQAGLCAVC